MGSFLSWYPQAFRVASHKGPARARPSGEQGQHAFVIPASLDLRLAHCYGHHQPSCPLHLPRHAPRPLRSVTAHQHHHRAQGTRDPWGNEDDPGSLHTAVAFQLFRTNLFFNKLYHIQQLKTGCVLQAGTGTGAPGAAVPPGQPAASGKKQTEACTIISRNVNVC